MNEVQSMTVFLRVAELSSFTQAARQMGLPIATVSTAVQGLEEMLGTRLLYRTTRRVQLTPDGAQFYERGKQVLADLEELRALFRGKAGGLRGRLRVDMPVGVARRIVVPQLAGFLRQHPDLQVDLGSADRQVDPVKEGFDCVLRIGRLSESSLVARRLGRAPLVNCASPAYVERHGMPRTLADLAGHRIIEYDTLLGARAMGWEWFDGRRTRHEPMPVALTVNNTETYMAACLAGLGIIQVPAMAVSHRLEDKTLVALMPGHVPRPMPVSLLYQNRRHLPPRVSVFMAWLQDVLAPYLER